MCYILCTTRSSVYIALGVCVLGGGGGGLSPPTQGVIKGRSLPIQGVYMGVGAPFLGVLGETSLNFVFWRFFGTWFSNFC
jgi:hypothetical protein